MKKGAIALGACAVLAVGAIVVSSSIGAGGGGGKGPYHFHSGVFVRDQSAAGRIFVENLTNKEITVKVKFSSESEATELTIGPEGIANEGSAVCPSTSCSDSAEIISKTPLIAPMLRWSDIDDVLHEDRNFIVTRRGKRLW